MSEALSTISAAVLRTFPIDTEVVLTVPTGVRAERSYGVAALQELMPNVPGGLLGLDTSAQVKPSLLAQTDAQGHVLKWNGAAWVSGTGATVSCYFFSGIQVEPTLIPSGTLQPEATSVTYDGNNMKAGDLLEELEIRRSGIGTAAILSGAPTRYSETHALPHFAGKGTGS